MANCGLSSVAWDHERVVVECHELAVDRRQNLLLRPAPEIGAADALGKQRVSREQNIPIGNEMKTRTAWRVSGSVDDTQLDSLAGNGIAISDEMIDCASFRHRRSNPLSLHVELFKQE